VVAFAQFVRDLVEKVDDQGKKWYGSRNMKVPHPIRYATPYGGRLVWVLPGQTKIICHLKDKNKIRHKKRWSQCMYMYYFLGKYFFLKSWVQTRSQSYDGEFPRQRCKNLQRNE
jgi:chitin synthase